MRFVQYFLGNRRLKWRISSVEQGFMGVVMENWGNWEMGEFLFGKKR